MTFEYKYNFASPDRYLLLKEFAKKNKLGEYGETAKAWSSEDAKGFIKVSSTALRAYYLAHPGER